MLPSTCCTCKREDILWKKVSDYEWLGTDGLNCDLVQMGVTNSIFLSFCFFLFFLGCNSASSECALKLQSSSGEGSCNSSVLAMDMKVLSLY